MNKIVCVLLLFSFIFSISIESSNALVTQIGYPNGGLLDDTWFPSNDAGLIKGLDTKIYVGNSSSPSNISSLLKFSLNNSVLQEGAVITDATLILWHQNCMEFNNWLANFTVWGLENQTWHETGINYTNFTTMVDVATANKTFLWYNATNFCNDANTTMKFNVTEWVQYLRFKGSENVTFYINMSTAMTYTRRAYEAYWSKEGNAAKQAQLNITWSPGYFLVDLPQPTTYYNKYTQNLTVHNRSTKYSAWQYSLNNHPNLSFTYNNTNFLAQNGINIINVWMTATTGEYYNQSVIFYINNSCDSSTVGEAICGGDSMNYLVKCKQASLTSYQWDYSNLTFCTGGCFDGQCISRNSHCNDNCKLNETMCVDEVSYSNCINYASLGCNDWNTTITYCRNGCSNGVCITPANECKPYETRCKYIDGQDYISWCLDENNDSVFTLSTYNKTFCSMGCRENYTLNTDKWQAWCNFHSFNDMYNARNATVKVIKPLFDMFDVSNATRYTFWFILTMIITGLIGWLSKRWKIALFTLLAMMWIGTAIFWWPVYITLPLTIISALLMLGGKVGDNE